MVNNKSFRIALSATTVEAIKLSGILFPTLLDHAGCLECEKTNVADPRDEVKSNCKVYPQWLSRRHLMVCNDS